MKVIEMSKSQHGLTVKMVTAPAITSLPPTGRRRRPDITVIVTDEVTVTTYGWRILRGAYLDTTSCHDPRATS